MYLPRVPGIFHFWTTFYFEKLKAFHPHLWNCFILIFVLYDSNFHSVNLKTLPVAMNSLFRMSHFKKKFQAVRNDFADVQTSTQQL